MKNNKDMLLFLLGAFLLPLAALAAQSIINNTAVCFLLYGIQAASPTISALTVLCMNGQLKSRLAELFRPRGGLIKALFLPPLIACTTMFAAKGIYCLLCGVPFTFGKITAAQFIVILWALAAEELGWRGFLQPALVKRGVTENAAPLITGVIWCLWHYHFFIRSGISVPLPLFLAGCVCESYIYSFLMDITGGNLVSAMMYHFSWNLFLHIAAVNPPENGGNILPYFFADIIEALLMTAVLIHKMRADGSLSLPHAKVNNRPK